MRNGDGKGPTSCLQQKADEDSRECEGGRTVAGTGRSMGRRDDEVVVVAVVLMP